MSPQYLGNDPKSALKVAKSLYPHEINFEIINQGQENLVIVVGKKYNVRFPRSEEIWQRGLAERSVLSAIATLNLPVPKMLAVSENPAYIQTTYLRGEHLDANEIRRASKHTQRQIGREIATFAHKLHRALPTEKITPLLVPPTWSYDAYLKKVLFDRQDPNPKVDALAKQYYHAWLNRKQTANTIIVHDDLHAGNLLFDDDYHLVGVLDFGAVCLGTPEQELRQAYRLGNEVFDAAATTYESLSGQPFDRDMAQLWTITQELASYCREDSEIVHKRAFENLCFWFPELSNKRVST